MSDEIRQIMPVTGWRAIYLNRGGEVQERPVVCFALLEPPYADRGTDGPEQPVVPMVIDTGHQGGTGVGIADIVLADASYWANEESEFERTFITYLGPGETKETVWVVNRIAELRRGRA